MLDSLAAALRDSRQVIDLHTYRLDAGGYFFSTEGVTTPTLIPVT
jgi:hypothetical protein